MIKIVTFSLLLFTLFSTKVLFSQENTRKTLATQQLEELADGYLLVQLFNRDRTKHFIRQELGDEAVKKYELTQLSNHKKLMKAFQNHYFFSKVLFFYSADKNHVLNQSFENVTFYGYDHEVVKLDTIKINSFYVGELSRIETDSITYTNSIGESHKRPSYGFSAFIIRDNQFRQLTKPFPYYTRTLEGVPIFRRKENALIKSLQSKLERKHKSFKKSSR